MTTIRELKNSKITPSDGYEVTIEITQHCPEQCFYCSSKTSTRGKHISLGTVGQFLLALKGHKINRINISGGEPLSNPDFYPILQMCINIVGRDKVFVYTNAIQNIVYNTDVIREINVEANVCLHYGDVYIPRSAKKVHLLKMIPQGFAKESDVPPLKISSNLNRPELCHSCNHLLLQADGKISDAPCKKSYKES